MTDSFTNISVIIPIKILMTLPKEFIKIMYGSGWKGMAPSINMTFKSEEEKHTTKLFIIDFIRFTKFDKIKNVLSYRCSILTIKLQLKQVINRLIGDLRVSHFRQEVQNRSNRHNLSSGPSSSTIVDGAGNSSTKGYPRCEVQIRPHTVWNMSPI